ncbi:unnamed protein product [Periconia digitata]|uniref:Uncharacterized protein n=1 Tax=Periconia digitata TaxID=1303443 RepID=A0A9W4UNA4_9PLEO|nr:unnamed protein product [Periconia digitata]
MTKTLIQPRPRSLHHVQYTYSLYPYLYVRTCMFQLAHPSSRYNLIIFSLKGAKATKWLPKYLLCQPAHKLPLRIISQQMRIGRRCSGYHAAINHHQVHMYLFPSPASGRRVAQSGRSVGVDANNDDDVIQCHN